MVQDCFDHPPLHSQHVGSVPGRSQGSHAQAPAAAPLVRQPAVKLRPFFWNKVAWRPDVIWARVPQGSLTEEQLRALEALFPQAAPSPQGKAISKGGYAVRVLALRHASLLWLADRLHGVVCD